MQNTAILGDFGALSPVKLMPQALLQSSCSNPNGLLFLCFLRDTFCDIKSIKLLFVVIFTVKDSHCFCINFESEIKKKKGFTQFISHSSFV